MRTEILTFIVSLTICLIGGVALAAYTIRSRSKERDLLWVGLFAVLYGADLVLRNPVFQLGFGSTHKMALFTPRILSACSIVPGLLLFEEFYGQGWHSLLRWLTVGYGAAAALAYGYMMVHNTPELMPSAGVILVICVPLVLGIGHISGYTPPQMEHANVLVAGLLLFFITFSVDHLRNMADGQWRPGLEPYGFIVLLACLTFVATQRVLADDRRLVTLDQEMQAAAAIQASILPRSLPELEQARVAVRYAPMTAVAGDFYDFPSTSSGCVDILLADVMGHGVPAALVASMVKVAVITQSPASKDPAQVLEALNSILCDEAPGQYVTAEYLHLDLPRITVIYSAAAHPPPLL
jgi:sigma-B regulation protein RsbU (phosphoserine phosphatase)